MLIPNMHAVWSSFLVRKHALLLLLLLVATTYLSILRFLQVFIYNSGLNKKHVESKLNFKLYNKEKSGFSHYYCYSSVVLVEHEFM